jgi:hypothetical protein
MQQVLTKMHASCYPLTSVVSSALAPKTPQRCPAFLCPEDFLYFFSSLVEETNDLARYVLAAGLLLVHDSGRGGEDNVAELTGREELDNPLLELAEADVVAGGNDTALVEAGKNASVMGSRDLLDGGVKLTGR